MQAHCLYLNGIGNVSKTNLAAEAVREADQSTMLLHSNVHSWFVAITLEFLY